ncbi:MAG TPA: beta-eliminating lyase-related protein, partial [Arenimonas sp.]|nr:beta-eliminating lyase-related protein [Arenimonas sp.]
AALTPASAAVAASPADAVDMAIDGAGLSPQVYVAHLQRIAAAPDFAADYYSNDGAIAALERKFAALLGKPAALFVPTGTLANLLAVRRLAGARRRVLVQAESHLYNDSGDGATTLAGLNLVPLAAGQADLSLDEVRSWVERSAGGRVPTRVGVIAIESPVRRRDHAFVDFDEVGRIAAFAREHGIRMHLDGARLFNLPQHTGRSLQEWTALFDTVYVSLWKHFNAASGAILAGSEEFIAGLFHQRRMFGGSLPGAWPVAAVAAAYAESYLEDYRHAWSIAEAVFAQLQADGRFRVRRLRNGTCRVFLRVQGCEPAAYIEALRGHGIAPPWQVGDSDEMAMQVNASWLRGTSKDLVHALRAAADEAGA